MLAVCQSGPPDGPRSSAARSAIWCPTFALFLSAHRIDREINSASTKRLYIVVCGLYIVEGGNDNAISSSFPVLILVYSRVLSWNTNILDGTWSFRVNYFTHARIVRKQRDMWQRVEPKWEYSTIRKEAISIARIDDNSFVVRYWLRHKIPLWTATILTLRHCVSYLRKTCAHVSSVRGQKRRKRRKCYPIGTYLARLLFPHGQAFEPGSTFVSSFLAATLLFFAPANR